MRFDILEPYVKLTCITLDDQFLLLIEYRESTGDLPDDWKLSVISYSNYMEDDSTLVTSREEA
jgi:hypothetical protein